MVNIHGIVTPFLVIISLLFMVMPLNSFPQNYNENVNRWRSQPRRYYSKSGYVSNQGSHPADYHPTQYRSYHSSEYHSNEYPHRSDPTRYNENYGYQNQRTQPEPIALLHGRSRGPSKEVVPTPSKEVMSASGSNQFNSSEEKASSERDDRLYEDSKASSGNSHDQNDFVFPSERTILPPSISTRVNSYVPDVNKVISKCGKDAIFCDFRGDYPSDLIRKAFSSAPDKYGDLLGSDEIKSNVSITTRFDVPSDGTPMCGSKEQIITPPAAKNKDEVWKWIVNDGPYVQGIRVEMCDNPNNPCRMADNFPSGYKTECKQKYIYRKLLTLDSSGQFEPDTFRLPSCCACIYRQDTMLRFMKPSFGTSSRRK